MDADLVEILRDMNKVMKQIYYKIEDNRDRIIMIEEKLLEHGINLDEVKRNVS